MKPKTDFEKVHCVFTSISRKNIRLNALDNVLNRQLGVCNAFAWPSQSDQVYSRLSIEDLVKHWNM